MSKYLEQRVEDLEFVVRMMKERLEQLGAMVENNKQQTKTPNQLRAEIIEKAKTFIEDTKNVIGAITNKKCYSYKKTNFTFCDVEFIVNKEKLTVVALFKRQLSDGKIITKGIAKCMTTDVFNEHLGKAIALGRALGLDVSEFEQAVQPTEVELGMKVYNSWGEIIGVEMESDEYNFSLEYARTIKPKIYSDTEAIYSEV